MQNKKFWFSVIAVWLVMFVTDWVLHGWWLGGLYQSTAQFWKPEDEMQKWMWVAWFGNFIFSWSFVWIYTKGISGDNYWHQAFRYALAILMVSKWPAQIGMWAYSAYPSELIWKWMVVAFVQAMACSFVMTWTWQWASKGTTQAVR